MAGNDNSFGMEAVAAMLPENGEYAVVVTPFNEGEVGDFEVTLAGPNGVAVFAADTLEEEGEEHAFPFSASEGEIVSIFVEPDGELDVVVRVLNDDTDEELVEVDRSFGAEGTGYLIPEDGNYYFLIVGFVPDEDTDDGGENIGDYSVTMLGSTEVVFELAYGDSVSGQFGGDTGFAEFWLSGTTGDTVTITLDSAEEVDGTIDIFDLDENALASIDDAFSGETETLSYTFESDGLVIIRASEFFGGTGDFDMFVDFGE